MSLYGPDHYTSGLMHIPDPSVVRRELELFVRDYPLRTALRDIEDGLFVDHRCSGQVIVHAPPQADERIVFPNYRPEVHEPEHRYLFSIIYARLEPYEVPAAIPTRFAMHGRVAPDEEPIDA